MRIGVIGSVNFNIAMTMNSDFDPSSISSGTFEMSLGGPHVEFCEKLIAEGNEVFLITSLNFQDFASVKKVLRTRGIRTDYVAMEHNGLGMLFNLSWHNVEDGTTIRRPIGWSMSSVIELLSENGAAVFDNLDKVIVTSLDPKIIDLCQKYQLDLYLYADDIDESTLDDVDRKYLNRLTNLTDTNFKEVLK